MLEQFHYTPADNSAEIVITRQDQMPVGVIRKARKLGQDEQVWYFLEHITDETTLAQIDALPLAEFQDFIEAWTAGDAVAGEASLGESSESSQPSTTE
ncbi:hypothetical protein [Corynebacterium variabile]|uniref:hypothetical protein n=1 Tax=Corynebacterium variabile TaxID=1727 RepID=UPI003FD023A7